MKPISIITTQQLIIHHKKAQLICDFYGPSHPKCKRAITRDNELYKKFLLQFKVTDDDELFSK